ncbi:FAD-binding oxidoreductase [Komagataeibacter rhaeticus]|uniref:FAD-binding oxidoreductase n=1 Tax=Komagataeibacter rhaeticus TaxID=215221 RepID=UPI0004D53E56|nr:FAD-binding oxidoreductase [Komagataeibacter rhaeticus]KDU96286.1 hypothetical protein GLUCORHAEAF1_03210 [Komagataeibacter rhaeticus AF1]MBL7240728.1 FAD-binding protein [Komagataeibacter rhaeticus]PYD54336.1 FAD-binding oxidoreductase [Komagataeibacter rhaeticus]GBQ14665.1 hypothetical protein AA16663_1848 [Komagataeibacter rhaeticus DSM 16663]
MAPTALQQVLAALTPMPGEDRISLDESIRAQHGHGEGWMRASLPGAMPFAHTTQEVSAILARCHARRVPVVPFGAGTSLEGHVTPPPGTIGINLSHMTRILQVNADDLDCRVKAGVTRQSVRRTQALGGSRSGEFGSSKVAFMQAAHGTPALDVTGAIKRAPDPLDILNPGKLLSPVLN